MTTDKGETVSAPYMIMATGNLSTPRVPDIPGLDSFKGKSYHTGLWPHEGVDFTGLRVGVIGTGSSGVQSIPHHRPAGAAALRVPAHRQLLLPAAERADGPGEGGQAQGRVPRAPRRCRDTPFGIAGHPPPTQGALEVTPEERNAAYDAKWQEGGSISFLYSYTDLLTNKEANDTAADFVRSRSARP